MSFWGTRESAKLIGTAVVVMLLGAFAFALTRPAPRDITLVVRGMAFYLEDGDGLPNPTIQLKAGERVRITLRNEERGIRHDFAVPSMQEALEPIGWNEAAAVTFVVPDTAGSYDYWCRPHMLMMRGKIIVHE
jgi:FtsP/CotA-like multicopper oxidase with cupredoxin domain